MPNIEIQVLDDTLSSEWWNYMIRYFIRIGDSMEIHCWNEESDEIESAMSYLSSERISSGFETIIRGVVTEKIIQDLDVFFSATDKVNYNKMTRFFAILIENKLFSEHYGTEMYLFDIQDKDMVIIQEMLLPYADKVSMHIEE